MLNAEQMLDVRHFGVRRVTPVRAIVSAGRGLPALPALRVVVEAVVSTTASRIAGAPGSGAGDRALAITNFQRMETVKSIAARAPQRTREGACASLLRRYRSEEHTSELQSPM